jgi:sarcosine oxidase subunit alpha
LPTVDEESSVHRPLWRVRRGAGKSFVDFQNDVTTDDIELAGREGFQSVEHLKRYTTLGMATDQGKTSNVTAIALMAAHTEKSIAASGRDDVSTTLHTRRDGRFGRSSSVPGISDPRG